MPQFDVEISGFGKLPIDPVVAPETEFINDGDGQVISEREIWELNGRFTGDADTIETNRSDLVQALKRDNLSIKLLKDGNTFRELNSDGSKTLTISGVNVEATNGLYTSVMNYSFTATEEADRTIAGVYDVDKEIRTISRQDRSDEKEIRWTARGPGGRTYLSGKKPDDAINWELRWNEFNNEGDARATVPLDDDEQSVQQGLKVDKTVTVRGGGPRQVVRRVVGGNNSLIKHQGRKVPAEVSVDIRLIGSSASQLNGYNPGFSLFDESDIDGGPEETVPKVIQKDREGNPVQLEKRIRATAVLINRPNVVGSTSGGAEEDQLIRG